MDTTAMGDAASGGVREPLRVIIGYKDFKVQMVTLPLKEGFRLFRFVGPAADFPSAAVKDAGALDSRYVFAEGLRHQWLEMVDGNVGEGQEDISAAWPTASNEDPFADFSHNVFIEYGPRSEVLYATQLMFKGTFGGSMVYNRRIHKLLAVFARIYCFLKHPLS